MYNAIVTRLTHVKPHPDADKIQLAFCLGNQIVISLQDKEDDLGVYFPTDGQVSHEFCHHNNLYRDAEKNKNPEKKGMFDDNRRVRTQKFRGEVSDGFWIPLYCLDFISTDYPNENEEFTEFCGVSICNKYISKATKMAREQQSKKAKNAKTSIMFKEHFDTEQLGKYLYKIDYNQFLIITEKLHGTSGRVGNVLVNRNLNFLEKFLRKCGVKIQESKWEYMNGTRRVVLEEQSEKQYHDPNIREKALELFRGKLHKGETVFFEIVGFESTGAPIMASVSTDKLQDKTFAKKYGKMMTFAYGCPPCQSDVFVYRITSTNEDGVSIDYTWDQVMRRCNYLGVKHVPELQRITLNEIKAKLKTDDDRDVSEKFMEIVNHLIQGDSIVDASHIREGVCVRIEGGETYKHKSFEFKVLEGIWKDTGVVDIEEVEG